MNSRRVDEHHLRLAARLHALDGAARGLRLVRRRRDLPTEDRVEDARLAHVGPPDEGDRSAARLDRLVHTTTFTSFGAPALSLGTMTFLAGLPSMNFFTLSLAI